jgi:glycosyltransferase involved in cell wall biosynthesis
MLVEIARLLPDVTFRVMGTPNWTGPGTWQPPDDLPGNVEMLGHVDGRRKQQLLAESWILVSCALHEGLPVSYVEALAYENVLVACQDPDAVVSQFGRYVGQWPSSGLAAVSAFADAIRELIDQDDQRRRLARRGAQWAQQNHCYRSFLKGFANICETLQIGWDVSIDEFE